MHISIKISYYKKRALKFLKIKELKKTIINCSKNSLTIQNRIEKNMKEKAAVWCLAFQ